MKWIFILYFSLTPNSWAGAFEFASGFSYSRSFYSEDSFNWTKRLGLSLGYHFSDLSEVEFAFQDILERTVISGFEDTTFHDRIYSMSWVQNLLAKSAAIQPYFKLGVGQLNRDASGNYLGFISPPARVDSITGVLGAGFRLYLTKTFAFRVEATSYLAKGSIRGWKNNVVVNFGLSLFF